MGPKAGFTGDALFDISSVRHDDLGAAPATPPSGQVEVYIKGNKLCRKDSAGVEYCYEDLVVSAESKIRFALPLLNNAQLQNGQNLTYSELFPNTDVIVPRAALITDLTFANSDVHADAQFKIYKNSISVPNLLYTWNIVNSKNAIVTGLSITLAANDILIVNFTDTGTKPQDTAFVVYFQSI